MPTGYGQQAAILATGLLALGHEVVISAFCGLEGPPVGWNGIKVLSSASAGDLLGSALLAEHARAERADLVLTLCDAWALDASVLKGLPLACWLPVDCRPLSVRDQAFLKAAGAVPVAMSRHGERMLQAAGFRPLYVPHALHDAYAAARTTRGQARAGMGIDGQFVIGINATAKDPYRKGLAEQLEAFSWFWQQNPASLLLVHSRIAEPGGLDLDALARRLGIAGAVRFSDQRLLLSGQLDEEWLATWYAALDLYSGCSLGEGFGLPLIEAQACGTPVVVTNASAMAELRGPGWMAEGEPFWNPVHEAWWRKPYVEEIFDCYHAACDMKLEQPEKWEQLREDSRAFARRFSTDRAIADAWAPALHELHLRMAARDARLITGADSDPAEAAEDLWGGWRPGELAWDVGANTGQSLEQLHALFKMVIAFEPAEESYARLAELDHGWLTTSMVALGDADGELVTSIREQSIAGGQLTATGMPWGDGAESLPWGGETGQRAVPCRTADRLAAEFGIPDFIKVDTEGHEAAVLRGAVQIHDAGRTGWLVEFHSADLYAECMEIFMRWGYAARTIRHPHYPPGSALWSSHGWIRAIPYTAPRSDS